MITAQTVLQDVSLWSKGSGHLAVHAKGLPKDVTPGAWVRAGNISLFDIIWSVLFWKASDTFPKIVFHRILLRQMPSDPNLVDNPHKHPRSLLSFGYLWAIRQSLGPRSRWCLLFDGCCMFLYDFAFLPRDLLLGPRATVGLVELMMVCDFSRCFMAFAWLQSRLWCTLQAWWLSFDRIRDTLRENPWLVKTTASCVTHAWGGI